MPKRLEYIYVFSRTKLFVNRYVTFNSGPALFGKDMRWTLFTKNMSKCQEARSGKQLVAKYNR